MSDDESQTNPPQQRPTVSMVEPRGGTIPQLDPSAPRVDLTTHDDTPLPDIPFDISTSFLERSWLAIRPYLPLAVQAATTLLLPYPLKVVSVAMKNKKIIAFIVGLVALIATNFVGLDIPIEGNVALVGLVTFLVGLISPTPGAEDPAKTDGV